MLSFTGNNSPIYLITLRKSSTISGLLSAFKPFEYGQGGGLILISRESGNQTIDVNKHSLRMFTYLCLFFFLPLPPIIRWMSSSCGQIILLFFIMISLLSLDGFLKEKGPVSPSFLTPEGPIVQFDIEQVPNEWWLEWRTLQKLPCTNQNQKTV